jgi:hypothetical protein
MVLEEKFYVSEFGFNFEVQTGLNLVNFIEGDFRAVLRRPDGSVSAKNIPLANVLDTAKGTVLFPISGSDLKIPGRYAAQVFVRDQNLGVARPSHVFQFDVELPLGDTVLFPWE